VLCPQEQAAITSSLARHAKAEWKVEMSSSGWNLVPAILTHPTVGPARLHEAWFAYEWNRSCRVSRKCSTALAQETLAQDIRYSGS